MSSRKEYLSSESKCQQRLQVVRIATSQGTQMAAIRSGISARTIRAWKSRFETSGIAGLRDKSRAPKRVANKKDLNKVLETKLLELHKTEPGLTRMQILVILLGEATADLATLAWVSRARKRLGLTKVKKEKTNHHKHRYEIEVPGCLQIDTKDVPATSRADADNKLYQFTAIDECSRVRFLKGSPDKGSIAATNFLVEAVAYFESLGVTVTRVQTDNGTEYTLPRNEMTMTSYAKGKTQEHIFTQKCNELGIRHKLIAPASPQLNGKVERSHRIDNDRFYSRFKFSNEYELDHAHKNDWMPEYNEKRPHGALGWKTPMEFLKERLEKIKNQKETEEKIIKTRLPADTKIAA